MKHLDIVAVVVAALGLLVSSSCASSRKQFERRLTGTWKVTEYRNERQELQRPTTAPPQFQAITFERRGRGRAVLFSDFSAEKGNNGFDFEWACTENTVTIRGFDAEFARAWIVVENKRNSQRWKSTDGGSGVQTLVLQR